jgi:hypothetical protein
MLATPSRSLAAFALLLLTFPMLLARPALGEHRTLYADAAALTLEDRIPCQRAIEEVYWRHRIWPKDNAKPKPTLDKVMPLSAIRAKVEDGLRKSEALRMYWNHPITGEQLQRELVGSARDKLQIHFCRRHRRVNHRYVNLSGPDIRVGIASRIPLGSCVARRLWGSAANTRKPSKL